jgi:hypothetical protein
MAPIGHRVPTALSTERPAKVGGRLTDLMFSRVKTAIRFFFVGLVVGVLLAPRSGRATRRLLRVRADHLFNELLDAATLGAYETAPGDMTEESGDAADADETGGSNGQTSTRKKATAPAQS